MSNTYKDSSLDCRLLSWWHVITSLRLQSIDSMIRTTKKVIECLKLVDTLNNERAMSCFPHQLIGLDSNWLLAWLESFRVMSRVKFSIDDVNSLATKKFLLPSCEFIGGSSALHASIDDFTAKSFANQSLNSHHSRLNNNQSTQSAIDTSIRFV